MIVLGAVERAQLRILGAHPVVQLEAARPARPSPLAEAWLSTVRHELCF